MVARDVGTPVLVLVKMVARDVDIPALAHVKILVLALVSIAVCVRNVCLLVRKN